jgi:hypothetical protein
MCGNGEVRCEEGNTISEITLRHGDIISNNRGDVSEILLTIGMAE